MIFKQIKEIIENNNMKTEEGMNLYSNQRDRIEFGWFTETNSTSYTQKDITNILEELINQFGNAKYQKIGIDCRNNKTMDLGYFSIYKNG